MGGDHPSERRRDDEVGRPGAEAAGSGHQTHEQAAITGLGAGGRTDAERRDDWRAAGEPGRDPPPHPGGASAGHADRKVPRGPNAGETVVSGQSKAERERAEREGR